PRAHRVVTLETRVDGIDMQGVVEEAHRVPRRPGADLDRPLIECRSGDLIEMLLQLVLLEDRQLAQVGEREAGRRWRVTQPLAVPRACVLGAREQAPQALLLWRVQLAGSKELRSHQLFADACASRLSQRMSQCV